MAANIYDVIVRPVITERSMATAETKKYTFEVLPGVVTTPANNLSVYDIINAKYLVADKDALAKIEEVYA